jgi:hypothetical protein
MPGRDPTKPEQLSPGARTAFRPFPEQDENGVDLSLIRENLRLTPTERVRKADRARISALRLLEYGRKHRATLRP